MNFEFLNMPAHHPARDMWDTFFTTTPGVVLRTHTSPGQIHVMRESAGKPIRVILPGMCYRNEAISTRSEIQFHQVEGLVVGEGVTMADLKGTITAFARRMFGPERQVRIRSSYFPFTEPSIEVDIDWPKDDPNRDRLTKGTGWLEILGAGMVHPNVLRAGGYDPDEGDGLRVRHGPAADADAQARHRRHPPLLAERPAILAAVLIGVDYRCLLGGSLRLSAGVRKEFQNLPTLGDRLNSSGPLTMRPTSHSSET